MLKQVFLTAGLLLSATFAQADQEPGKVELHGQLRMRTMFNKPETGAGEYPDFATGLRTRLAVIANPSEKIRIHIEAQDSRNFGEEPESTPGAHHTASTGSLSGLDLHQAFVQYSIPFLDLTAGRQKIILGSQRFLSSLEWHPNARVFDGVSLRRKMSLGAAELTGVLFKVRDSLNTQAEDYLTLSGLHYRRALNEAVNLETYVFYDKSGVLFNDYDYFHIGGRINGKADMFFYDQEFIWQAGSNPAGNKAAFYNATRAGAVFEQLYKVGLGFDMMSGDDDPAQLHTYNAHYFFAHAYFGWMDYFAANRPRGVMDFRFDLDIPLSEKVSLKSQNHFLMEAAGAYNPYGTEFDLEFQGNFFPKSSIILGMGILIPDAGMANDQEAGYQVYLMPVFFF